MHYVALKLTVRGRHSMSQELTLLLHQNVKSAMDKILAKELPHVKMLHSQLVNGRAEIRIHTFC